MIDINSIVLTFINLLIILNYNIDSIQGIQGGRLRQNGEFTYHVAILINNQYACGGAILDARHAISAGQCVLDMSGNFIDATIKVLYGLYDGWAVRNALKVNNVYVLSEFREPGRVKPPFPSAIESADLSILETDRNFPLGATSPISNVFLPSKVHHHFIKYAKKEANITGYGVTIAMNYESASNLSSLLGRRNIHANMKYLRVLVERTNYCKVHYSQIQDSHLCAISNPYTNGIGAGAMGVCHGDIGGPLVRNNEIIGVLQIYANDCDDREVAALYTRITSYDDFIGAVLEGRHFTGIRVGNYTGQRVHEIFH